MAIWKKAEKRTFIVLYEFFKESYTERRYSAGGAEITERGNRYGT